MRAFILTPQDPPISPGSPPTPRDLAHPYILWSQEPVPRTVNQEEPLKLSAVTSGTYLPTENKALPSDQGFNPAHEVRPGDLLFTRKNTTELVAACAYVRETPPGMLLPDLIYRLNLREDSGLTPRFVQQTLMYPEVRKRVQRLAGGSAGSMPNISKAKLATVRIPRPPYEVQLEFDRRLDKLDMLMLEVEKNGYALDFLCSSLQSRAFRGEL